MARPGLVERLACSAMKSITINMERATGQLRNPLSLAKQAQEEMRNLLSKVLQNCVACSDLSLPGRENDTQAEKMILMLAKGMGAMYQVGKGERCCMYSVLYILRRKRRF